jgi:hypothetical protein
MKKMMMIFNRVPIGRVIAVKTNKCINLPKSAQSASPKAPTVGIRVLFYPLLMGSQRKSNRPVIDQRNLHIGTELAEFNF